MEKKIKEENKVSISKMKIKAKIGLGFGILLLLSGAIGVAGYWGANSIIRNFHHMLETDAAIADHSARAQANVLGLRRYEKDIFLNIGAKEKEEEYLKKWKEQYEHLLAEINDLEKAAISQQDKDIVKTFRAELAAYNSGFNKVYEMIREGKIKSPQEGNKAINEYKDEIHKLEKATEDFSKEGDKRMASREKEISVSTSRTISVIIILVLVSIIFGLGISIFILRSITKPINRVVEGLTEGAEQVASASAQVSSASQSLAEGASEQAAGIQETSSSIEEMASMTKKNAESANQANNLMMQTSQVVDEANKAMKELINSMNEISTTSEETAKIIKTIDEIAFQTNLLALNAAVEAARAGEAGAGFAVVADEVRNLAMRAAEAAKNTASLIEESVKKIKNGSQIVSKTNEAFEKVAVSSKKVAELMAEIAAASQEQSQGIEQINKAVAEMDKVVQKNAASAEESASAAEEMNAQAETLKGFVEELTALVGRRDGNGWVGTKEAVGQRFEVKKIGGNGGKHLEKVVSKIGGLAKAKKDNGKFANKEAVPKQVIPLEEGDFKEF
jgi:methyl-accepting chemotaxis protein